VGRDRALQRLHPIRDPELFESLATSTRVLEATIEVAQAQGELSRDFSARRLASMLEGILFRLCLEWGANFPRPHLLGPSLEQGFELFARGASAAAEPARARKTGSKR